MDCQAKIQKSIHFIEDNLCEDLKLNDIANQSYFSTYYFHKLFCSTTGQPVMAYVRNRRLEEAAKDLRATDKKITDIAFKYQFGSEESFSRAFKKVYGISPRQYRGNNSEIVCIQNLRVLKKASQSHVPSGARCSMAA